VTFLLSNVAFATCDKPVTYLGQGSTSPCSGFLFSPEKELEVRILVETLKKDQEIKTILEKRLEITQLRLEDVNNQLYKREQTSQLEKSLYFVFGALITGFIANNVK